MNAQLLAVMAVGMIGLGIFGLIGLWVYSRIEHRPRHAKRRDSDLIVSHRFKSERRKRLRLAPVAPAPVAPALVAPDDESLWRRPGGPLQPPQPKPLFFGEGQPRHIRIDNTPHVIIPHETVGPETHKPLSQATRPNRRNQPTVLIKTVRVEPEQQPPSPKADKLIKFNKSNNTIPLKRIK